MNNLPPPRISKLPPPRKIATPVVAEMQDTLFDMEEDWTKEWKGMPEFKQEDLSPFKSIIINFVSYTDIQRFSELCNLGITPDTRSTWYPRAPMDKVAGLRYRDRRGETSSHRYVEWRKDPSFEFPATIPQSLPSNIESGVVAYNTCLDVIKP